MVYFAHVIWEDGVGTDQSKVAAMLQQLLSSNICRLYGFLGLTDYYFIFCSNHALSWSDLPIC